MTLRRTLRANAIFSFSGGVLLIVTAGTVSNLLGIPIAAGVVIGMGLVPWAALVWWLSAQDPLPEREVLFVVAGDLAWVAATIVVLVGFPDALSTAGKWLAAIAAVAVADFAIMQFRGLRARPHVDIVV